MATAAFKSTTRRSSIGSSSSTDASDSGSSNRSRLQRRSRSLSRFSDRFLPPDLDEYELPKARFVNTVRGSEFPEIDLDDLAKEFSLLMQDEEKDVSVARGRSTKSPSADSSKRRARSVSRSHRKSTLDNNSSSNSVSDGSSSSKRSRPVSVARDKCHDLESCSSALTDSDAKGACNGNGLEKIIRAVYSQEKIENPAGNVEGDDLYEAMKKEVRHAVEEIKMQLQQLSNEVMVQASPVQRSNAECLEPRSSDPIQAIAGIRNTYAVKLEQSEKRTQDLLAQLAVEEQRGREFSKIVKEFQPNYKQTTAPEKSSRARKRSNDKTRISNRLTEEAEKYFEDFISNVEDTDFSSFDGEKSDTCSTVGRSFKTKEPIPIARTQSWVNQSGDLSLPADMDGVVLPWLKWEVTTDLPSLVRDGKVEVPLASRNASLDAAMVTGATALHHKGGCFTSSLASWSPDGHGSSSAVYRGKSDDSALAEPAHCHIQRTGSETKASSFDMDEYLSLEIAEDRLFEKLRQRRRTESGGLLLCCRTLM